MKQIRAEQIRANPISDRIRVCVWRVVFLNTRSLVESCRAYYYYQHLSLSKSNSIDARGQRGALSRGGAASGCSSCDATPRHDVSSNIIKDHLL